MIVSLKDLRGIRKKHKNQKIIYTSGAFDLLHAGHIKFLKDVREMAQILVVGITPDKRVRQKKGDSRPIHTEKTRVIIMDAIKYVNYVFIDMEPTLTLKNEKLTLAVLTFLKPNIFFSINPNWLNYKKKLTGLGVKLTILPVKKIDSTTDIINRVASN